MARNRSHRDVKSEIEDRTPIVNTETSRCGKCGSTEREPFNGTREFYHPGVDRNGQPYTHIVWRRTRCKDCRNVRVERTLENRPGEAPKINEGPPEFVEKIGEQTEE